jgi:uncharacterized protein YndB with AHSA1/START domain
MSILTRSAVVDAPVETVFEYALDPRKLWSVPDIALAEVEVKPEGAGTTARIWYHFLGFHLEGGLEYKEVTRPERIVIEVNFFMEHPTWTFTFEPKDEGTKVTIQGEWHLKAPIVGGTYEKLMAKDHEPFLDTMLSTMKAHLQTSAAA